MGFCVRLSSKVFYCGDFAELSRREEEALSYSALHGDDLLVKGRWSKALILLYVLRVEYEDRRVLERTCVELRFSE